MGERPPFDKAKTYGITKPQARILFRVAAWFNGVSYTVHGQLRSIASGYEPTLRELCGENWEPDWSDEHQQLTERGFFKSAKRGENVYLAGRRCAWLPSQTCMEVIEHIFSNQDQIYPPWVLDEHTRPPTFRDGNELMEHRKGTLAAAYLFGNLERVSSVEIYPRVNLPQRPDLRLWSHGEQLARVEVLTDHRKTESWRNKFEQWRVKEAGPTVWLFENRQHMVRFWNHLIDHGIITLDGGRFGGRASNWSPRRVNDRLQRSRKGAPNYSSHDAVWTIPGVVEGDRVDAFRLFKRANIILQS
ncbi:hypothetical protein AArcSl_0650 [Halalkaliarchaeum desulfuricum]|uniref:Uncharacterized protein n=1 Tax=Halalkaliarchaeum desulfuricum TaxID=2055893 RepID=A0A343TGS8_9EURY|nr:hypothetical protein [Halalkaliarchaeum desulfuricum]AUX08300.1 hypothetical protein AArcSl_0650 [Halalkaliarchaeum desulfuricum]